MPQYRVELAKSARATCQGTVCKKNAVKIEKGALRHGNWVEIKDVGSWKWKHWGCITPVNCETWRDITDGGDPDLIDGYDELDEETQAKVLRAIKQGHVDDEDWIGDVEKNRPGERGYFNAAPKKGDKDAGDEGEEAEKASPVKAKGKKGKKAEKAEPEPKATGKKAKQTLKVEEEEAPTKQKRTTKKSAVKPAEDAAEDVEEPAPATKKRGRPKKAAPEETAAAEPPAKKAKTQAKKDAAAKASAEAATASTGRGRKKKA